MRYEWDPDKAATNEAKHGVRFADAVWVFEDELAVTIDDPHPEEERFVTIGLDAFARVLVVVYTWRDGGIRLISARKASRSELTHYAEGGR
jgi:uncharacterized DUF497 family protein